FAARADPEPAEWPRAGTGSRHLVAQGLRRGAAASRSLALAGRRFDEALERREEAWIDAPLLLQLPLDGEHVRLARELDRLERAAEGAVQHLQPAAQAEQRQLLVERALHELQLERIPVRIRRGELRVRLLAVAAGLDVAAPAEDDAVADVENLPEVTVADAG